MSVPLSRATRTRTCTDHAVRPSRNARAAFRQGQGRLPPFGSLHMRIVPFGGGLVPYAVPQPTPV
jgi:hypothetical protein